MKKLLSFLLVLLLTFTFFGCKKAETEITEAPTEITEPTESATVKVTFPEGKTLTEIAQKLEDNGVCSAVDFVNCCEDISYFKDNYGYDFLNGIDEENTAFPLEGYIFPDTYEFYRGEEVHSVVNRFLSNFNSRFTDEMKTQAQQMGFTVNDVVVLASIIQDECSFEPEMNNVSSVFVNRIKSSSYGKLQSDVTINYVNNYITDSPYSENFNAETDYAALYNTYKCEGLPVGAICCPGLSAMKAAINPAETDYYFFVTDKDMNYYYSNSYEKHLENCTQCGIY